MPKNEEKISDNDKKVILQKIRMFDFLKGVKVNLPLSEDSIETIKKLCLNIMAEISDLVLKLFKGTENFAKDISNDPNFEHTSLDLLSSCIEFISECLNFLVSGKKVNVDSIFKNINSDLLGDFEVIKEKIIQMTFYLGMLKYGIPDDFFEISKIASQTIKNLKELKEKQGQKLELIKGKRSDLEDLIIKIFGKIPVNIISIEEQMKNLCKFTAREDISEEKKNFQFILEILTKIGNLPFLKEKLSVLLNGIKISMQESENLKIFVYLNKKWNENWESSYENLTNIQMPLLKNILSGFSDLDREIRIKKIVLRTNRKLIKENEKKKNNHSLLKEEKKKLVEGQIKNSYIAAENKRMNDKIQQCKNQEKNLENEKSDVEKALKMEKSRHKEQKQNIMKDIRDEQEKINDLTDKSKGLISELEKKKDVMQTIRKTQETINELKNKLSASKKEVENLEKKNKTLENPHDIDNLRSKYNNLNEVVQTLENISKLSVNLKKPNFLKEDDEKQIEKNVELFVQKNKIMKDMIKIRNETEKNLSEDFKQKNNDLQIKTSNYEKLITTIDLEIEKLEKIKNQKYKIAPLFEKNAKEVKECNAKNSELKSSIIQETQNHRTVIDGIINLEKMINNMPSLQEELAQVKIRINMLIQFDNSSKHLYESKRINLPIYNKLKKEETDLMQLKGKTVNLTGSQYGQITQSQYGQSPTYPIYQSSRSNFG